MIERFVGVIDLKDGRAVHAIAGQRASYREVSVGSGTPCGNPQELARHYQSLGVRRLYVADLDGIVHGRPQAATLCRLLQDGPRWQTVLIDLGWRARNDRETVQRISKSFPQTQWIVATEAADSIESLAAMVDIVGPSRTALGMDYRVGKFICRSSESEDQWFAAANEQSITSVVALDIASVGTGIATCSQQCSRIARIGLPDAKIYSGGGVKNDQDAQRLFDAGCDFCLAATCLHQIG